MTASQLLPVASRLMTLLMVIIDFLKRLLMPFMRRSGPFSVPNTNSE